uniref:UDP-N-acetylglucosamine diphosphorylase n=1 Tax=Plectus sambesii TaxID=2011161 RepID=A0A914XBE0_9BILA
MSKTDLEAKLEAAGQSHLLRFYDELPKEQQKHLVDQINVFDMDRVCRVFKEYAHVKPDDVSKLTPITADHYASVSTQSKDDMDRYWQAGLKAIAHGEVAVIVLAGGQATRLGADRPKGTLSIGLLRERDSLLDLQAAQIAKLQKIAQTAYPDQPSIIQWFVMTSMVTSEPTEAHLDTVVLPNEGLDRKNVHYFSQGEMPCFTVDGKLMLQDKHRLATSPDGNGGLYRALQPLLPKMSELGVKYVHVYCVDNILCRVADPHFIGYCIEKNADCAAKVVEKIDPFEAVGIVCAVDGVPRVVEYSEITPELAQLKDSADPTKLAFRAGNIANHFFTVDFLKNVCSVALPFHPAHKKIPYVDDSGELINPQKPNGIKMEQFVFDVFLHSKSFYVWEVPRDLEFSPLKNADVAGKDCAATCRQDLWRVHHHYVKAAGGKVLPEDNPDAEVPFRVEIDPSLSYAGEDLEPLVSGKTLQSPLSLN